MRRYVHGFGHKTNCISVVIVVVVDVKLLNTKDYHLQPPVISFLANLSL